MTAHQRAGLLAGLVVLGAILGLAGLLVPPPGSDEVGLWPVVLGTIACLLTPRRLLPATGTALGAADAVAIWLAGRSPAVAVVLGVGLAAHSLLVRGFLAAGPAAPAGRDRWAIVGRPPLRTHADLGRFLRAVLAGSAAAALAGLVAGLLSSRGDAGLLALSHGAAALAGELAALPLFCRMRRHPSPAGVAELAAQWALLVGVPLVVFSSGGPPGLVLLVFPVLGWACLRLDAQQAMLRLLVVDVLAVTATSWGHGPLARPDRLAGSSGFEQAVVLTVFVVVTALLALVLSVTVGEQVHSTRAVAAERDRLHRIVESIGSVAVIGTDENARITLFNRGAEQLLGYDAEQVLGLGTGILHTDRAVAAKAAALGVAEDLGAVARAMVDQGPTEMSFVRVDGEERRHLMSLHRVLDDRGEVTGFVSTSEDLTELLDAQARLTETLETERQALEHLREVDRIKDGFVSSVSHELRTPLTSILGYLELLQEGSYGPLDRRQGGAVERMRHNCSRLLTLISDLLDLGRLQEGAAETSERLDLRHVVRTVVPILAPTAAARVVRLAVRLPEDPLPLLGQRGPLERVVINLVGNAVKFTASDGRVDVRAWTTPDEVLLEVADTGIGIPTAEQHRLFDRFFRSSLAQQAAIPGSGLGLAITHAIVEQHGGRIEVSSTPGVGTTFTVRLPRAPAVVAAEQPALDPAAVAVPR